LPAEHYKPAGWIDQGKRIRNDHQQAQSLVGFGGFFLNTRAGVFYKSSFREIHMKKPGLERGKKAQGGSHAPEEWPRRFRGLDW